MFSESRMRENRLSDLMRGGSWLTYLGQLLPTLPWSCSSVPENDEVYVLCRSAGRKAKERAMRWRWLRGLIGDLRALRRRVASGQLKQPDLIQQAIGRLSERHPQAWRRVSVAYAAGDGCGGDGGNACGSLGGAVSWTWDREARRTEDVTC